MAKADSEVMQKGTVMPGVSPVKLDEYIAKAWEPTQYARAKRKHRGPANYKIVRYADDFIVMIDGHRQHAEDLREETSGVLAGIRLRLSVEKTSIIHIDEGFDFLGFRIQRRQKRAPVSATSTRSRPVARNNAPGIG
ncbi:MAG: reverse transcriptase domain-containing protein [Pseudonocardia sp.]